MSLDERNEIAPQMRDYDQVTEPWIPYLMRFHKPQLSLPSVSTDENGFRNTTAKDGGTVLTLAAFSESKARSSKGVVLGSSAAFGVGATHDKNTLPSILNGCTDTEWFNFGGRAYNSTQEMLLFLLYLPKHIKKLVIFSGINNLTLSFLSSSTSPVFNSFFFQSVFERAMDSPADESIGVRRSAQRLLKEIEYKLFPENQKPRRQNIDSQYENILTCFKRDAAILKGLSEAFGFQIYFAFQPIATWIEKELTDEETRLFSILDRLGQDWQVLAEYIASQKARYINDVWRICIELQIPFYDLNSSFRFTEKEWLFVDRVHLTDKGYGLVAEVLKKEFGL